MENLDTFEADYRQWMEAQEQREAVILALVADDLAELARDNLPLADILRGGFTGYDHLTDYDLISEAKERGLNV